MIQKSEIAQAILHGIGCDADDWLEAARKGSAGFEGAKHALREAAKHVQQIADVVDSDLESGKIEELDGPLQIAAYTKKQIARAADSLTVAALNYSNRQMSGQGEISAYEKVVKHLQEKAKAEADKIEHLRQAIASGELQIEDDGTVSQKGGGNGRSRPLGVRPAQGIAAQRRAEDAEAKAAKADAEVAPADIAAEATAKADEVVVVAKTPAPPATPKKKRGRPKGSKNKPKKTADAPNA